MASKPQQVSQTPESATSANHERHGGEHLLVAGKALLICLLTLLVYSKLINPFVDSQSPRTEDHPGYLWDDPQEIEQNPSLLQPHGLRDNWVELIPVVKQTLTKANLKFPIIGKPLTAISHSIGGLLPKVHVDYMSADYWPMTATVFWAEYRLWGNVSPQGQEIRPVSTTLAGYHFSNALFQMFDALLVWLLLWRLRVPGSWLAGLLFAVYPVHVESVGWISEHKNTISMLFFLLSAIAYVQFDETALAQKAKRWGWWLAAFLLFVTCLLAKSHMMTMPAVILLYVWWRRGKITLADFVPTIPFWCFSLFSAWLTNVFQNAFAIGTEVIPIGGAMSRLAGSGMISWWYIWKAIFPFDVMTIYPEWNFNPVHWYQFLPGIALIAALIFLWMKRAKWGRTPFFVLAFFVGTLAPVMGFAPMSYMRLMTPVADHFQYFSDIAIIGFISAGLAKLWQKRNILGDAALAFSCLLVGGYTWYSCELAQTYFCEKTYWAQELKHNADSWQAHSHMGAVLYGEATGYSDTSAQRNTLLNEAYRHFLKAHYFKLENPETYNNLALCETQFGMQAQRQGKIANASAYFTEALANYKKAIAIKDVPLMRTNYANLLYQLGRSDEALKNYDLILKSDPNNLRVRFNVGIIDSRQGNYEGTVEQMRMILARDPSFPHAQELLFEAVNRAKQSQSNLLKTPEIKLQP